MRHAVQGSPYITKSELINSVNNNNLILDMSIETVTVSILSDMVVTSSVKQ